MRKYIKDRGNIKWTALMLTEHRDKLKKLKEMDGWIEKPELDEQELERLDALLQEAIKDQFTVKLLYYRDKRINELEGKLNLVGQQLFLDDRKLLSDNIIDIKLL